MKTINSMKLVSAGLLSLCVLALGAPAVLAADPVANTEADVKFVEDDETAEPNKPEVVDPTDPGEEPGLVDPEGEGSGGNGKKSFNINWISKFKFGEIKIAGKTMTAFAQPTTLNWAEENVSGDLVPTGDKTVGLANFLQVTDNTGSNAGWNVTVKANPFLELTSAGAPVTPTVELAGAQITLNDPQIIGDPSSGATAPTASYTGSTFDLLAGGAHKVLSAADTHGQGTWTVTWGATAANKAILQGITVNTGVTPNTTSGNPEAGVQLSVPVSAKPKADTSYRSTLEWTLASTPGA